VHPFLLFIYIYIYIYFDLYDHPKRNASDGRVGKPPLLGVSVSDGWLYFPFPNLTRGNGREGEGKEKKSKCAKYRK